jgi:dTDP-4-amino-4,6-dideoxygalactose transaminase
LKIKIPHERKNESVNWYLYTISNSKKNKIIKKLNSKGIGAVSYYSIPVHKTPFYKQNTKLPITDWASSNVLSLPIHPKVTSKNIEFIAKSLREVLDE